MARSFSLYSTLEVLECLRCGSSNQHPVRADLYRCADCGMTYHLEWVGNQVLVRQPTAPHPSPPARWDWLPLKVLLLVLGALLVLAASSFWVAPGH